MRGSFFLIVIVLLLPCSKTNNKELVDDSIIEGCSNGIIFTPERLSLDSKIQDTIVSINRGGWSITHIQLVNGKDTAQLYAGKDFPRQEYDCQLINLGWIEIEKKEGIDNVYIFIKEGTSEFRECGLHFSFLEGHGNYFIQQHRN